MKDKQLRIAIVILAAGESSRMGTIKQLLPWKDSTLLGHTIRNAEKSLADATFVVLGANADEIKLKLDIGNRVPVVFNDDWETGMGSSISKAMLHFERHNLKYEAVLICLADQPLLETAHLNRLIAGFKSSENGLIATKYAENVGVPALFDSTYFEQLKILRGQKGAKKILENNPDDVYTIEAETNFIDLDTPESYQHWYNSNGKD